jgi:hypothetical protein
MALIGVPDLLTNLPKTNFVRTVYHNEAARQRFAPFLAEYGNAWLEAEQMSVLEDIRPLCLQPMSQPEYLAFLPWAHDNGLHARVKRFAGAFQGFSHYYTEGSDILVVAMSKERDMVESDNCEQFLGYPECCQTFFAANFPKYIDPVLQWANYEDSVVTDSACNPVLRPLGVRGVSHIPCSTLCSESISVRNAMRRVLPLELAMIADDVLTAPMSWDCYRGIAIVKTPWFRTIYRSVPYKNKVVVKINER